MDSSALRQAVKAIAELEREGLLADAKQDLAAELRHGPRDDLKRFPHSATYVRYIADEAAQFLGLPYQQCLAAAAQELLPTTSQKVAIRTLNRYVRRLRGGQ